MNNIKISVIIPVYNTEKYLKRCLDSVINQSLKEIEIIIINDCSTDSSLNILEKYLKKDNRIILINKKKNEGLLLARYSGIKISKGEYISHIDSDDWIEKDYLLDMYKNAKKNFSDIVISDFYIDYDNGKFKYFKDQNNNEKFKLTSIEILKNIFNGYGRALIWNKLIKREIYLKNNIIYKKINFGEDGLVFIQLLYYSTKVSKQNKAYYHYIQNFNSISNSKINMFKINEFYEYLHFIEEFLNIHKINLLLEFNKFKINRLNFIMFNGEYDLNNSKYKGFLKEYLKLIKDTKIKNIISKRFKIYCFILKIFNNGLIFSLIYKLERIMKGIKNLK